MSVNCVGLVSVPRALTRFKHTYEPHECAPDPLSRSSVKTPSPVAPPPTPTAGGPGTPQVGAVGPSVPRTAVPRMIAWFFRFQKHCAPSGFTSVPEVSRRPRAQPHPLLCPGCCDSHSALGTPLMCSLSWTTNTIVSFLWEKWVLGAGKSDFTFPFKQNHKST